MKNTFISLAVFVAAILASMVLNKNAMNVRLSDRSGDVGNSYVMRDKPMTAGFDSVLADLKWMQTYLRGAPHPIKELSEAEKKVRLAKAAQLEQIGYAEVVSLDPTFEKAYRFAVLRLMIDMPREALQLADRGMLYCRENAKDFAELAAYISFKVMNDNQKAFDYYKKCVEGGPAKDYIGRQYLRTLVRLKGFDPHSEDMVTNVKILMIYNDEHQAQTKMFKGFGPDFGMGMKLADGSLVQDSWVKPVLLRKTQELLAKVNMSKAGSLSEQDVAAVKKIYDAMKPPSNLCSTCYAHVLAGDKFCAGCGTKVETYGVCTACGAVLKGRFCHECGKDAGVKTAAQQATPAPAAAPQAAPQQNKI